MPDFDAVNSKVSSELNGTSAVGSSSPPYCLMYGYSSVIVTPTPIVTPLTTAGIPDVPIPTLHPASMASVSLSKINCFFWFISIEIDRILSSDTLA